MGTVRRVVDDGAARPRRHAQPGPAALAIFGQCLGWTCQLFAVWTAMRAFNIHEALPAAAARAAADERRDDHPALAGQRRARPGRRSRLPLVQYGVDYGKGFAFGLGLQAIEASVGVGIGLIFLGREGLSFARLREMPGRGRRRDEGGGGARERAGGASRA